MFFRFSKARVGSYATIAHAIPTSGRGKWVAVYLKVLAPRRPLGQAETSFDGTTQVRALGLLNSAFPPALALH